MLKKIHILSVLVASLWACSDTDHIEGSNQLVSQELQIENFIGIVNQTLFPIYVAQGDAYRVSLTGNANLLSYTNVTVKDNILHVGFKKGVSLSNVDMFMEVQLPKLEKLVLDSTGDIILQSSFEMPHFELLNQGTGDIVGYDPIYCEGADIRTESTGRVELYLMAETVHLNLSGTSQVRLVGGANTVQFVTHGTAGYQGALLETNTVNFVHNSTDKVEVFVRDTLKGKLQNTGDLFFKGNPILDVEVEGTGKLVPFP